MIEDALTAVFLYGFLGSIDGRVQKGFARIAIGLTLTLVHLIFISRTGISVKPAFFMAMAPEQLWLF